MKMEPLLGRQNQVGILVVIHRYNKRVESQGLNWKYIVLETKNSIFNRNVKNQAKIRTNKRQHRSLVHIMSA